MHNVTIVVETENGDVLGKCSRRVMQKERRMLEKRVDESQAFFPFQFISCDRFSFLMHRSPAGV